MQHINQLRFIFITCSFANRNHTASTPTSCEFRREMMLFGELHNLVDRLTTHSKRFQHVLIDSHCANQFVHFQHALLVDARLHQLVNAVKEMLCGFRIVTFESLYAADHLEGVLWEHCVHQQHSKGICFHLLLFEFPIQTATKPNDSSYEVKKHISCEYHNMTPCCRDPTEFHERGLLL